MFKPLRFLCFNDDGQSFTCAMPDRYCVFGASPLSLRFSRADPCHSIGAAVTCRGHRFIAFSGLPADPDFNTRHVCVVDHDRGGALFRSQFASHVLAMRLAPALVLLAFHQRVEAWNTETGALVRQVPTAGNVYAPIDISGHFNYAVFAGAEAAALRIAPMHSFAGQAVRGADDAVAQVRVSPEGILVACANADGKIVRVFETANYGCIGKFKRGNTATVIHALAFSPDCSFLAAVSQNGTIHFFDLRGKRAVASPPTFRSIHKISIGQAKVVEIMWGEIGITVMMPIEELMLVIAVDPLTCHEVGRAQVPVLRKIEEEIQAGA
jgi:hypothetical protein